MTDIELEGMRAAHEANVKDFNGVEAVYVPIKDLKKLHHALQSQKRFIDQLETKIKVCFTDINKALQDELKKAQENMRKSDIEAAASYRRAVNAEKQLAETTKKVTEEKEKLKAKMYDLQEEVKQWQALAEDQIEEIKKLEYKCEKV